MKHLHFVWKVCFYIKHKSLKTETVLRKYNFFDINCCSIENKFKGLATLVLIKSASITIVVLQRRRRFKLQFIVCSSASLHNSPFECGGNWDGNAISTAVVLHFSTWQPLHFGLTNWRKLVLRVTVSSRLN